MIILRTFGHIGPLPVVILVYSCLCQVVNSEDCKKIDDSHCRCRTDSGYEIDLNPLADTQ